jgi:hypothetical protein
MSSKSAILASVKFIEDSLVLATQELQRLKEQLAVVVPPTPRAVVSIADPIDARRGTSREEAEWYDAHTHIAE